MLGIKGSGTNTSSLGFRKRVLVLNVPQTMLSGQDGKICISEVLETININAPIKDEMTDCVHAKWS
jgi:hypothetical protein